VHYAQPLLREAELLAQEMDSSMPAKQRLWLGLQMRRIVQLVAETGESHVQLIRHMSGIGAAVDIPFQRGKPRR
jgi:hypothetical protein